MSFQHDGFVAVPTTTTTNSSGGMTQSVYRKDAPLRLDPIDDTCLFKLSSQLTSEGWLVLDATFPRGGEFQYETVPSISCPIHPSRDRTIFPLNFMSMVHSHLFRNDSTMKLKSHKIRFRFFHRLAIIGIMFIINLQSETVNPNPVTFDFVNPDDPTKKTFDDQTGKEYVSIDQSVRVDLYSKECFVDLTLYYPLTITTPLTNGKRAAHFHIHNRPSPTPDGVGDGVRQGPGPLCVEHEHYFYLKLRRLGFPMADSVTQLFEKTKAKLARSRNDWKKSRLELGCHFLILTSIEHTKYESGSEYSLIAWLFCIMQNMYRRKYSNGIWDLNTVHVVNLELVSFKVAEAPFISNLPLVLLKSLNLQTHLSLDTSSLSPLFNGWIKKINALHINNDEHLRDGMAKYGIEQVNILMVTTKEQELVFLRCMMNLWRRIHVVRVMYCIYVPDVDEPTNFFRPPFYLRALIATRKQFYDMLRQHQTLVHFMHMSETFSMPFNDVETFRNWMYNRVSGLSKMTELILAGMDEYEILTPMYSKNWLDQAHKGEFMNDRIYDKRDTERTPKQVIPIQLIHDRLNTQVQLMRGQLRIRDALAVNVRDTYLGYMQQSNDPKITPLVIPAHIRNYEYVYLAIDHILHRNRWGKTVVGNPIKKFTEDGYFEKVDNAVDIIPFHPGDTAEAVWIKRPPFTHAQKVDFLIESIFQSNFFSRYFTDIEKSSKKPIYEMTEVERDNYLLKWKDRQMVDLYLAYFEQVVFCVDFTMQAIGDRAKNMATFNEVKKSLVLSNTSD